MGFVNENITFEEREALNKRNLMYKDIILINPINQTIDYDLRFRLISCGVLTKDDPKEKVFFIEWEGLYFFVKLHETTKKIGPHPDYLIIWSNFRILSASRNEFNQKGLIEHLKSALRVYGMINDPDPYFRLSDGSIVECDF